MTGNNKFTIGDVTISIKGDSPDNDFEIPSAYFSFSGNAKKDISLRLHYGLPAPPVEQKVFETLPIWSLYHKNGTSIIKIFKDLPGYGRTLVLPHNIEYADLYFDNPSGRYPDPFYGPTMELLMVNYLAQGRGIIIHGCGIEQSDRGILFVGESGAGKTTMARMWSREFDVEVLSDDRTIVRKKDDHYVMYGTPWHGEGKFGSPRSVKLDQIFFLKHGQKNSVKDAKEAYSVKQFLKCSFPPLWDARGMEFAMEFLVDLSMTVPCQELTFKPDSSIIDFIKAQGAGLKA